MYRNRPEPSERWDPVAKGEGEPDYMKPPQTLFERSHGWVSPAEKMLTVCMVILIFMGMIATAWVSVRFADAADDTRGNRALICTLAKDAEIPFSPKMERLCAGLDRGD
jgi:hypothetical protein